MVGQKTRAARGSVLGYKHFFETGERKTLRRKFAVATLGCSDRRPPFPIGPTIRASSPPHCGPGLIGMITISRHIEAPAERVWTQLVETRYWPTWGVTILDVDGPDRLAAGTTGRVRTVVGLWLDFSITEYDEAEMFWEWVVAGIPATTHRVISRSPGACTAEIGVPRWAPPYVGPVWLSLRRLERLATNRG